MNIKFPNIAYPHGIMFHHFHDGKKNLPSQGSITAVQFSDLIEILSKSYKILTPNEWIERATLNKLESKNICFTFDDNLKSQFDVAIPVLKSYGVKAFFFAYTCIYRGEVDRLEIYKYFRENFFKSINEFYEAFYDRLYSIKEYSYIKEKIKSVNIKKYNEEYIFYTFEDKKFRYIRDHLLLEKQYFEIIDQWMIELKINIPDILEKIFISIEELKNIRDLDHAIGLHSDSHPTRLDKLSYDEQDINFKINYEFIKENITPNVSSVAYPCGLYSSDTLIILKKMGIKIGFRDNIRYQSSFSALEFPRENHSNLIKKFNL